LTILGGVRLALLRFYRFNDKLDDKKHNKTSLTPCLLSLSPKVELITATGSPGISFWFAHNKT
jgi:hypothetical protein